MAAARAFAIVVLVCAGVVAVVLLRNSNSYFLYVINLTLVNAIAAVGLVLLSGVAGQISLATAGLVAIGAYGTGILMTQLGIGFLPAAVCGTLVAAIIGTVLAAPALRLSGLHLAIVTLAFGIIVVQFIGKGGKLTGGMSGLFIPPISVFGWQADTEYRHLLLILPPFLAAAFVSINFARLKPGRALHILRDREIVARTLGIDTSRYKIFTFAYSAFLCGLSGALLAALKGYVSVDDFSLWSSLYFFVMIVVGGMTSVVGGIIGAVIVTVLPEALRGLQDAAGAALGVITLVIFILVPGGIVAASKRLYAFVAGRRPRVAVQD
jgi:ABC-type branched-subunit amino acid transport system permease subunit